MQADDNERGQDSDRPTPSAMPPQPQPQPPQASCTAEEVRDIEVTRTEAESPRTRGTSKLPHKKSARGMSMRRSLGLKIEADASGKRSDSHSSDTNQRSQDCEEGNQTNDTNDQAGGGGGGEEWWKVEYKAPPPGHLGAHAVARDDDHTTPLASPSLMQGRDSGEGTKGTAAQPAKAAASRMIVASTVERPQLRETPERARKIRVGSELYDAPTNHSSPNPKRKIMALHDIEAGTFPSMGVAKELKRFHETNGELQVEGESELARTMRTAVVTPSKLLRPMKRIDLQAGSAPPASVPQPLEKSTKRESSRASESA